MPSGGPLHRVVILGGGFAGLMAAKSLAGKPVEVTLVDRRNFHLFQPLLYQVATGGLSPADIAAPLRWIFRKAANVRTLLGEAEGIDIARRRVRLAGGEELEYDSLIVATGARHHYFGRPEWEHAAPGLKTIEDATEIRSRILAAFEAAEREPDAARRQALLTFLIVGGGPTGVELAGALGEIANDTLRADFRAFRPSEARILLLEAGPRILSAFPSHLSDAAERSLLSLGVRVRTGTAVTAVSADGVHLKTPAGEEFLPSHTVLWAAGVQASPLAAALAEAAGPAASLDRAGRLIVDAHCRLPGHPEIYVLGDMAHCAGPDGQPLPGVAPVAMQQGRYAAGAILAALAGRESKPFSYFDKGNLATIGRHAAIADFGRFTLSGYLAWLAWLAIHIAFLIGFRNRIQVLIHWAFQYLTFNRGARIITEREARPQSNG
jgi:NADH:ubiquinone reductase (H+-translocating)